MPSSGRCWSTIEIWGWFNCARFSEIQHICCIWNKEYIHMLSIYKTHGVHGNDYKDSPRNVKTIPTTILVEHISGPSHLETHTRAHISGHIDSTHCSWDIFKYHNSDLFNFCRSHMFMISWNINHKDNFILRSHYCLLKSHNRPIPQIPQCTYSKSHNVQFRREMWPLWWQLITILSALTSWII